MTLTLRHLLAAAAMSVLGTGAVLAQDAATPAPAEAARILPDIVLGQQDAPVTIVEYASFTCSHCAAFHNDSFAKLKSEYIDTGKVKFIQRTVYFDGPGLWAGILAQCGGDAKYYPVSDMLFSEQQDWLKAQTGEQFAENLRKIGAKAGMTNEQMDACWADQPRIEQMVATFQQHVTEDKIEATPTFIIGGDKVQNQPWDALKKIIDAKIASAG